MCIVFCERGRLHNHQTGSDNTILENSFKRKWNQTKTMMPYIYTTNTLQCVCVCLFVPSHVHAKCKNHFCFFSNIVLHSCKCTNCFVAELSSTLLFLNVPHTTFDFNFFSIAIETHTLQFYYNTDDERPPLYTRCDDSPHMIELYECVCVCMRVGAPILANRRWFWKNIFLLWV